MDGRLLFDGGASDPLPVSVAIREGCDIILAMGFENPLHERVESLLSLVSQTTCITINNLLKSTYSFYSAAHHAEIVPILPFSTATSDFATLRFFPTSSSGAKRPRSSSSRSSGGCSTRPREIAVFRIGRRPMGTESGRILVVDDVEMNRDLLTRRLEQQGHSVAVAENGRRAMEMLRSKEFDLVLLDIMMPEMDGYQVLKEG